LVLTLKERVCYFIKMNFILKFTGAAKPDLNKMSAILATHQIQVLDDSLLPKMALIKLEESKLQQLQRDLETGWELTPEKIFQVPTTKKKIKRS